MKLYYIYKLFFPSSDKIYIGQSCQPDVRYRQHIVRSLNGKGRMQYSKTWIKSHLEKGEELKMVYIDTATCKEEADVKEKSWISHFKHNGFILTNLTEGGDGCEGYTHTEDDKKKMSELKKGKVYPHMKKFKIPPEQQEKMQKACNESPLVAAKRKEYSEYLRTVKPAAKEYIITNVETGEELYVRNLSEWCEIHNIKREALKCTMDKKYAVYSGFRVRHSNVSLDDLYVDTDYTGLNPLSHPRDYYVTLPSGECVTISGLHKFCEENNLNKGMVHKVLRGEKESYKGYKFRKL